MRIYVLGNSLVKEDSLPIKLIPDLKRTFPEIEIAEFEPTEDFPKEKELIMIDTVINAEKVCLITDIEKIVSEKAVSMHDFDLGYNLKLMKKFGMIEKIKIIGLPPLMKKEDAIKGIKEIIKASLSSRNE